MKKILILLLLLTGCAQPPTIDQTPAPGFHEHHLFEQYAKEHGITEKEAEAFFLQTYQIDQEEDIFDHLPTPPEDFHSFATLLDGGDGNALAGVPENVYLQPEFYPTFHTSGVLAWINAPDTKPYTIGVSGTPGYQEATVAAPGGDFNTTLFVTSSWGSTVYQGMRLRYKVRPVALIRLEFDTEDFVLGPAFPTFSDEWAKKITIRGTMNDVPEGEYHIYIYPDQPNPYTVEKWKNEGKVPYINAEGTIYSEGGIGELVIKVTPGE